MAAPTVAGAAAAVVGSTRRLLSLAWAEGPGQESLQNATSVLAPAPAVPESVAVKMIVPLGACRRRPPAVAAAAAGAAACLCCCRCHCCRRRPGRAVAHPRRAPPSACLFWAACKCCPQAFKSRRQRHAARICGVLEAPPLPAHPHLFRAPTRLLPPRSPLHSAILLLLQACCWAAWQWWHQCSQCGG